MTTPGSPTAAGAPPSVRLAFNLFIGAVGAYVVAGVLSYLVRGSEASLRERGIDPAKLTDQQRSSLFVGMALVLGLVLLLIAVFLVAVFLMRRGMNWARIVTAVLASGFVVSQLLALPEIVLLFGQGILGAVSAILLVIVLVLTITGIVFMFQGDAKAYFAAPR
jgi:hypothetical protein